MYILDSEGNKVAMIIRSDIEYICYKRNLVIKYRNQPYHLVIENPDPNTLKKYTEEWYAQNEHRFCQD